MAGYIEGVFVSRIVISRGLQSQAARLRVRLLRKRKKFSKNSSCVAHKCGLAGEARSGRLSPRLADHLFILPLFQEEESKPNLEPTQQLRKGTRRQTPGIGSLAKVAKNALSRAFLDPGVSEASRIKVSGTESWSGTVRLRLRPAMEANPLRSLVLIFKQGLLFFP